MRSERAHPRAGSSEPVSEGVPMRNLSIPLTPLVRILPLALALSLAGHAAAAAPPAAQKPGAQKPPTAPGVPPQKGPSKPLTESAKELVAAKPPQVPVTPQPPDGKWL